MGEGKTIYYPNLEGELAKAGLTKAAVAEFLDVDRCTIYDKINGKRKFTLEEAFGIQILLASRTGQTITLDYLFRK